MFEDLRFNTIQTKVYSDGLKGEYLNTCRLCSKHFLGYKWDRTCPDCATPAGSELNKAGERENVS